MTGNACSDWKPSACILCECNCGIEVQLEDRQFKRIRGDKRHPSSQGYACEKAHRLNYYQNGRDRITEPLRRKPDGSFEPIDWPTAIREVAERLATARDTYGGDSIFYYGGGGQGNHLPGAYATATRRALNSRYKSSALAQEKTGEFWINERMMGGHTRADFEHCDVALFLGKNPWFSHSIPRARTQLKELSNDPNRTLIVVDPRRTKSAELADIHLQVKPGRDAWLLMAMLSRIVESNGLDNAFLGEYTEGLEPVLDAVKQVPFVDYCDYAGVAEDQVQQAADAIAQAQRFSSFEDLGVQMNHHSTLTSYLHKLLWLLTGNIGKPGTQYIPTTLQTLASGKHKYNSPVTGSRIVGGLVPCNVIAEEILTDHPKRFRAMIVEANNPAHSLADSPKFREAMLALDTLVVIDVAMTETAVLADYVLPASTQFEKAEATFFNFEFPKNYFHLRKALMPPPDGADEGPLSEAEIHSRMVEELGVLDDVPMSELHKAALLGLEAYGAAFVQHVAFNPKRMQYASVILYRTLGPTLPEGLAEGAVLWGAALQAVSKTPESLARAGFSGPPLVAATQLFQALLDNPWGIVFAVDEWADVMGRIGTPEGKIQLALPDMLEVVDTLQEGPAPDDPNFPFVLCAGERRSFTANTIVRDPHWRKKDPEGALFISPSDALKLPVETGDVVRLTTPAGEAIVHVAVTDMMRPGHISLPNGTGLTNQDSEADAGIGGIAPNELTLAAARDPFVGTPWHKNVPARLERA